MAWHSAYYHKNSRIAQLRREIREVFKEASGTFNSRARSFIRTFRSTWVIDEPSVHRKLRYSQSNR